MLKECENTVGHGQLDARQQAVFTGAALPTPSRRVMDPVGSDYGLDKVAGSLGLQGPVGVPYVP